MLLTISFSSNFCLSLLSLEGSVEMIFTSEGSSCFLYILLIVVIILGALLTISFLSDFCSYLIAFESSIEVTFSEEKS